MQEAILKNKSNSQSGFWGIIKTHIFDIFSVMGLVLCVIIFTVTSAGNLWNAYNISILIETVCGYMILSLGALFVYSMGFMDVSVGVQLGVYSILMIFILNSTGSMLLAFVTVLVLALLCGAFNGAVAVWLGLPSIVTSLFLMFVFGGIQYILIEQTGSNMISVENYDISRFADSKIMIIVMLVVGIAVFYAFNFTKLGKYTKSIGANEKTAAQCGVNTTLWKVIAYMMFGVCVAIASVFLLARTGSAGKGTGSTYAMDIMLCIILGGMPLSGGMSSKVRCAVIGTLTYVLLSNGLTLSGVDIQTIHIIKAVIFLCIVLLTCRNKGKILPR